MLDQLSPDVIQILADRYAAAVAEAEAMFALHAADEDSLTGALGQALASRPPIVFNVGSGSLRIEISYLKVRGRGHGAPEKRFGLDGIFQLEIVGADGRRHFSKGLAFQSKTRWKGTDSRLLEQVKRMKAESLSGVVVDYDASGYKACPIDSVINAMGNRSKVELSGEIKPLGQLLSKDFLACKVGRENLFFDSASEEFVDGFDSPSQVITTSIREGRLIN